MRHQQHQVITAGPWLRAACCCCCCITTQLKVHQQRATAWQQHAAAAAAAAVLLLAANLSCCCGCGINSHVCRHSQELQLQPGNHRSRLHTRLLQHWWQHLLASRLPVLLLLLLLLHFPAAGPAEPLPAAGSAELLAAAPTQQMEWLADQVTHHLLHQTQASVAVFRQLLLLPLLLLPARPRLRGGLPAAAAAAATGPGRSGSSSISLIEHLLAQAWQQVQQMWLLHCCCCHHWLLLPLPQPQTGHCSKCSLAAGAASTTAGTSSTSASSSSSRLSGQQWVQHEPRQLLQWLGLTWLQGQDLDVLVCCYCQALLQWWCYSHMTPGHLLIKQHKHHQGLQRECTAAAPVATAAAAAAAVDPDQALRGQPQVISSTRTHKHRRCQP